MKYIISSILLFSLFASSVIYQAVRHDNTMTGDGITGNELKVDTSIIATGNDLLMERSNMNVISPAQLTADVDDYAPTGWASASIVRLSSDNGMRAITSFAAYTGASASDKAQKTLINIGSYVIYFPGEAPDGTAANRIAGLGSDFKLYPGKAIDIYYDGDSDRWRIIGEENTEDKTGIFFEWMPGNIGGGDWGQTHMAALGSGTLTQVQATTSLPNSSQMSTVNNAAWGYIIGFPESGGATGSFTAFGSAHMWVEGWVSIPTLSDGTETFAVHLQLITNMVNATIEQNNSIYLKYSHGTNSGKWELTSKDNAAGTSSADSGVTVAAATLYKLRIEYDKSRTEARAYINGAYACRVTGSMPNAVVAGARLVLLKSNGTTARTLNAHWLSAGAIYP